MSPRIQLLRVVATVLCGFAVVVTLLSVALMSGWGGASALDGSSLVALLGPLAFGAMAGTVAWFLLSSDDGVDAGAHVKTCSTCGSSVFDDWRLCPDCGRFIEEESEADLAGAAGANHRP